MDQNPHDRRTPHSDVMKRGRRLSTEPGPRDDHADTGHHLAPGATHLPGAAPVTAEIA